MITRMTVDNFKALRHVDVPLSPFTVLIGPNDNGKSSFLEAVSALSESTRKPLNQCFWSPWQNLDLVYKHQPEVKVGFTVEIEVPSGSNEERGYSLALAFHGGQNCAVFAENFGPVFDEANDLTHRRNQPDTAINTSRLDRDLNQPIQRHFRRIAAALPASALARWDVEELATPSRLPPPDSRRYPFDPSGYGLPSCIAEMKLGRGGHFESLRKDFCAHFPAFQDIIINPVRAYGVERNPQFQKLSGTHGDGYSLVLLRKDGVEIPAGLASGGTSVTLAFLTLIHLPEPRKLLLIEEPENGLHPARLKEIVPLLREVAIKKGCQVILTTHSPLLLDYVDPAEVRVFLRNDLGDIEVYNVADVPGIAERMKYMMLGELVYNEGEQELVKEIKQHAHTHSG